MLIEEVDYIAKNKDLFYVFLAHLDAFCSDRRLVIATTNKLNEIDKSLRRGGRLDIDIRLDMPSAMDRYLVLKQHLSEINHSISDEELRLIASAASGFVCSDLA